MKMNMLQDNIQMKWRKRKMKMKQADNGDEDGIRSKWMMQQDGQKVLMQ